MFILFLLILILLISYYIYRRAFYSARKHHTQPHDPIHGSQYQAVSEHLERITGIMERYPYEAVTIESFDGLTLKGRYYHLADGAPLEILMHGYRSHPYRDCAGGHALAQKMGFNTLVIDQRAHGDSSGRTITFGIKERMDCLSWIHWANNRFGQQTPIILSGLSMGAATVLMTADLDLPDNVACIMADSPYSSPAAIIEKVCADMHYPVALCRPFLHLGARIFGNLRLHDASALEAVQHSRIPILLIHGEEDHFVPCAMSREIAAAGGSAVRFCTFPQAGHGLAYLTDPERYEKIVLEFMQSVPAVADFICEDFIKHYYS